MPDRYGDTDPVPDEIWDAEQRRQRAIANCDLCNADGIRGDLSRCDHNVIDLVRQAMGYGVMLAIEDQGGLAAKLRDAGPDATLATALDELWRQGKIRHPFGWERHMYGVGRNEANWWRYAEHGPTRGEKRRMWCALVGMTPLSNDLPGGVW